MDIRLKYTYLLLCVWNILLKSADTISSDINFVGSSKTVEYSVNKNDDIRLRPTTNYSNPEETYANAYLSASKWPAKNSREYEIPYVLDSRISNNRNKRNDIRRAIREFDRKTCIRFRNRKKQPDYINIVDDGYNDCYSFVGRVGGAQDLSLGDGCMTTNGSYVGTAMHELMHTLGLLHEHARFDRDQYISINTQNIDQGSLGNFNVFSEGTADTFGLPYDYNSLMHYGKDYSARTNPTTGFPIGDTIIPKDPSAQIGQRSGFSDCDLNKINTLYPCSNRKLNDKCVGGTFSSCTGFSYLGLRQPLFRLFSSERNDHYYTVNEGTLSLQLGNGYISQGVEGSLASMSSDPQCPCLRPLYRLRKDVGSKTDHFYTIDESERVSAQSIKYTYEGIEGYCVPSLTCGATLPLHRYYDVSGFDHLYLTNSRAPSNYKDEGIECYVWP